MIAGAGNPNSKAQKNASFLRMYLFLNPRTHFMVPEWQKIVKPEKLKI
jgi:hypothetical protein